jgi:stearoyl-CoA desaturase (delta-9 desaturase)
MTATTTPAPGTAAESAAPLPPRSGSAPRWRTALPFLGCHAIPLLAFVTGVSRRAVVLALVLYLVRMFFITAGYHRYFAHRTYRMARVPQFVMAFGGTTAVQQGPLWWASHHRDHHRYADTERDPHSPERGFWWAHIGWLLSGRFGGTDLENIDDFAKFPELRWINRFDWLGPWTLGLLSFLIAGWSGLVIGFFASTVVLWHTTFSVNSFAHLFGRRRYATADTSRNSLPVALLTFGEGWHNNHHHYPASARQGFAWYELDISYLLLRLLALVGIVHDLRKPPAKARSAKRVRAGYFDLGRFRQHLGRAAKTLPDGETADELRALIRSAAEHAGKLARAASARAADPLGRVEQHLEPGG